MEKKVQRCSWIWSLSKSQKMKLWDAGKSIFLSVVSAAQPTIANYPFTTLLSVLVQVVDGSYEQPDYICFDAVRLELEMFSLELAEKPCLVVYNKMDIPVASKIGYPSGPGQLAKPWDTLQREKNASISEFETSHDDASNTWHVVGSCLQHFFFIQMTIWRYIDSERLFQHVLEACGVNKSLIKLGVKDGDTVLVCGLEKVNDAKGTFLWHARMTQTKQCQMVMYLMKLPLTA